MWYFMNLTAGWKITWMQTQLLKAIKIGMRVTIQSILVYKAASTTFAVAWMEKDLSQKEPRQRN
jgi:hypothetical protein